MKKAITPIVGIILLLLVTVIAIVSFGNWNINFSSQVFGEQENADPRTVRGEISGVSGDLLFFENRGRGETTVNSITINESDCGVSSKSVGASSVTSFNISSCQPNSSGFFDVKIITSDNIYVRQFYFE